MHHWALWCQRLDLLGHGFAWMFFKRIATPSASCVSLSIPRTTRAELTDVKTCFNDVFCSSENDFPVLMYKTLIPG